MRFLLAGFGGQLQEIPLQKLVRRRRSSKGGKMDVIEGKVSAAERGRVAISGNGCGLVWLGWNPRRLTKRGPRIVARICWTWASSSFNGGARC